jgi:Lon protease-like protein
MLLPSRPGEAAGASEYGTMLEIQSVHMLPDGRSKVETVGSFRFRVLEKGSLDGYTIGRIERLVVFPLLRSLPLWSFWCWVGRCHTA